MEEHTHALLVDGVPEPVGSLADSLEAATDGLAFSVASTAATAEARLSEDGFDCVASRYRLPERDGVSFLETVREDHPDLPFVLYTDAGSEGVAADAIAANVTEYVRWGDDDDVERLAERIETAAADGTRSGAPEREQRLEQTLQTVPSCVVELDADGQFVYANRRAEEVLGLDRSTVVQREYADPEWRIRDLDGDPIPDAELPFRKVLDSGAPVRDYRHSIRWPDGSRKVLSVSGRPLFDGDDVERAVFSIEDVTDRYRRETELRRYKRMIEHFDDVATIIDPDGTIRYVSPAVQDALGYEPEELEGTNGFGYQPDETSERVAAGVEAVLEDPDSVHTVQTKFRHADGSFRWVESTLQNHVDEEGIDGILVSSREVTDRVTRKEELRERERQLEKLHEATRELLASETPREVAATASTTAVDILDLPMNGVHFYDEAVDGLRPVVVSEGTRQVLDEVPVLDEGLALQAFRDGETRVNQDLANGKEAFDRDSPIRSEMYVPLHDRGVFIVSSTEPGAFDENDVELARLLTANTGAALERVDAERRLRSREVELQQQNERLEEFASIVSHDLRNPLNVAKARSTIVAEERDSEHIEYVLQALDRMEAIVSDTLTLASQGQTVAETEPTSLQRLVQQCWTSVESGAATVVARDDATIHCDRGRLQHVFENLFRNAVEHGSPDVSVSVGRFGSDGIYVEDTGPGIPKAERDAVFEPGHTSSSDGTGFGLTIVRRIVEAHGWEVRAVAGTDGGARFELTGVELTDP